MNIRISWSMTPHNDIPTFFFFTTNSFPLFFPLVFFSFPSPRYSNILEPILLSILMILELFPILSCYLKSLKSRSNFPSSFPLIYSRNYARLSSTITCVSLPCIWHFLLSLFEIPFSWPLFPDIISNHNYPY